MAQEESISLQDLHVNPTAIAVIVFIISHLSPSPSPATDLSVTPDQRTIIASDLDKIIANVTGTLRPASERTMHARYSLKNKETSKPVFAMMAERSPTHALEQPTSTAAMTGGRQSDDMREYEDDGSDMFDDDDDEVDDVLRAKSMRTMTIRKGRLSTRMSRYHLDDAQLTENDCTFVPELIEEFHAPEEHLTLPAPVEDEEEDDDDGNEKIIESSAIAALPVVHEEEDGDTDSNDELLTPAIATNATIAIEAVDPKQATTTPGRVRDTHRHFVEQFGTLRGETLQAESYRVVVRDLEKEKEWRPHANMMVLQEEEKKAKMKMKRMIKQLVDDEDNYERR